LPIPPTPDAEGSELPGVQYVPREDANMALLTRTERRHIAPTRATLAITAWVADGKTLENSIWTYETPFLPMTEITGHLASIRTR